jgi:hypothetical protein
MNELVNDCSGGWIKVTWNLTVFSPPIPLKPQEERTEVT